jgi:hypothetical protein
MLAIRFGVKNPALKNQASWKEFLDSELFLNLVYCLGREDYLDISGAACTILVDLAKKSDEILDALFTETMLEVYSSMKDWFVLSRLNK